MLRDLTSLVVVVAVTPSSRVSVALRVMVITLLLKRLPAVVPSVVVSSSAVVVAAIVVVVVIVVVVPAGPCECPAHQVASSMHRTSRVRIAATSGR